MQIEKDVQNIARLKARDMQEGLYFSHFSPQYGSLQDMMELYGIPVSKMAENIAGSKTPDVALSLWSESAEHKKNIVDDDFTHIGIGIANHAQFGKVYVQIFKK